MRILKTQYFFLTLFLGLCFTTTAQVDDFQKEIIDYLNMNGTRDQYREAYDGVFPVLSKNFSEHNIPEEAWQQLKTDKEAQVDAVIDLLAYAYRNNFTREQIQAFTQFYSTETAQKLVQGAELSETESQQVTAFFEGPMGQVMQAKRTALAADIETVSAEWSKELFMKKMQRLIKNGYVE